MTLEEVKEHLKDAKEMESTVGSEFNFDEWDLNSLWELDGNYYVNRFREINGEIYKKDDKCVYEKSTNRLAKIISRKSTYPKVMNVWDEGCVRETRVVLGEFNGWFMAAGSCDSLEKNYKDAEPIAYKYAEDIPVKQIKEVTLSEVDKAMGVDVNCLRIKE